MTEKRPPPQHPGTSAACAPADGPALHGRRGRIVRRVGSVTLLLLLIAFWWFFVYTFLVAGWWLLRGYPFADESQNPFVWNGLVDWVLMGLALLSVWPAHRWLRTRIAHFIEDSTDDPYAIISQLSEQVDNAPTTEAQIWGLVQLLAATLNAPYVRIEMEEDGLSAEYGDPPAKALITLPLQYNQRSLGKLHIAPRIVGGAPLHMDEHLLTDLARQVGLALYSTQLSTELQESRRRIVTAREEGRRQLRRDLHDGLGPSLATLTMQADTARETVYENPAFAEELLAEFVDQTQAMVTEVRRIVHGLRPPALDDVGLYGALELLVNGFATPALQTAIRLPETQPALSAALEVAIYRIVQEALTNISKHAHARTATVVLEADDPQLVLSICDDGVGIPAQPDLGLGLHSMRERAEELGGVLTVRSNTPKGSCIIARFPLDTGDSHGTDSRSDL
ncbi:MAG: sensor histidine kinase [Chloroflexi bacterium]|nr:MAG: sensor histidine kinase [Chloroflexota bacterium]